MVISRIVRLGPAEGCLQVGDEIQYVNEVKVIGATGDRVIMLVKTAANVIIKRVSPSSRRGAKPIPLFKVQLCSLIPLSEKNSKAGNFTSTGVRGQCTASCILPRLPR